MTVPFGEQNPAYTELEGRCGNASPFSMQYGVVCIGKRNHHTFVVQQSLHLSKFHIVFAIDDKIEFSAKETASLKPTSPARNA